MISAVHVNKLHANKTNNPRTIRWLLTRASIGVATVLLFYTMYVLWSPPANVPLSAVMGLHTLLFSTTAVLALRPAPRLFPVARTLFLVSLISGLAAITMLWKLDIGLQYFLLLLMVGCNYLFTYQERRARDLAEIGCLLVFIGLEVGLLAYNSVPVWSSALFTSLAFGTTCLVLLRVIRKKREQYYQHHAPRPWYSHLLTSVPSPDEERFPKIREFKNVSVLFADLEGYTRLNTTLSDSEIVKLLDALYRQLDSLAASFGIEKIKTNGDQYMAVSGLEPGAQATHPGPESALRICYFAYAAIEVVEQLFVSYGCKIGIRIGIATGPVTGGVIGQHKPCFDVWGQTVNLAARLEQYCSAGNVMVCPITAASIGRAPRSGFRPGPQESLQGQYPAHSLNKSFHSFV